MYNISASLFHGGQVYHSSRASHRVATGLHIESLQGFTSSRYRAPIESLDRHSRGHGNSYSDGTVTPMRIAMDAATCSCLMLKLRAGLRVRLRLSGAGTTCKYGYGQGLYSYIGLYGQGLRYLDDATAP